MSYNTVVGPSSRQDYACTVCAFQKSTYPMIFKRLDLVLSKIWPCLLQEYALCIQAKRVGVVP